MTPQGFAIFRTAIGPCGIAWGDRGVTGVLLPVGNEGKMRARLARQFPDAHEGPPPPTVTQAEAAIVELLAGEPSDLSAIVLDMHGVSPFHRKVYDAARTIAPGATVSYGQVAARLGMPGSARAVGQALGRNPFAIIVPCHRVLAANGKVGGFSADGGIVTKIRMLSIEAKNRDAAGAFEGDGGLGFDADAAVDHVRRADPKLAALIEKVGPFRLRLDKTPSIFVALAEAIVYQQLTARAAATIFARVRSLFPRSHEGPTAEQILRAKDDKLRTAGLSGSKLASLKDLAMRAKAGEIPTLAEVANMTDEQIVERLTRVRGIGRWTVEMLLIFRLGRPDVLPADDYGVRKGFALAFKIRELPTRKAMERRGARWKPYRTVASWYLWRALDAPKT
jgi:O-6-methylguanine DNA methyltransferase